MNIDAHFEDIEAEILRLLRKAKYSVRICVAWINSATYKPILGELASRGVKVEVICHADEMNRNYGLPDSDHYKIYRVQPSKKTSFMHNKFCIIDDEILITGSFNWSKAARYHFENIVVVRDQFTLVKSFLHEFYDLIWHYEAVADHALLRCQCGSYAYNLGLLGEESGLYEESRTEIWTVCVNRGHVMRKREDYFQYLRSQLLLKGWQGDFSDELLDGKSKMLAEFEHEQLQITLMQNFFNKQPREKVHAVGTRTISNYNEHIKFGEDEEPEIVMLWRDMRYRKIIPEALYPWDEGEIEKLFG